MPSIATRFALGLRKVIGHAFLLTGLGLGLGEFFVKWYHASDVVVILYVATGLTLIGMDMAAARLVRTLASQIAVQPGPDSDSDSDSGDHADSNSGRNGGNGGGSPGVGPADPNSPDDAPDDAATDTDADAADAADGAADARWPAGQSIALAQFLDRRTVPIPGWTVSFPDTCAVLSGARG